MRFNFGGLDRETHKTELSDCFSRSKAIFSWIDIGKCNEKLGFGVEEIT